MKILNKSELEQIDGYIVDGTGTALHLPKLAAEFNEVAEVIELMAFVKDNRERIELAGEAVTYTPHKEEAPVLKVEGSVSTPLRDAEIEKKKALAEEFLTVQAFQDINGHLVRYTELAKWFASENVKISEDGAASKFNGDLFGLTEDDVITAVTEFNDAELTKLRRQVNIQFA